MLNPVLLNLLYIGIHSFRNEKVIGMGIGTSELP